MPSIQAEPRQIPTGMHYYSPANLIEILLVCALDFIPTPGNYVGNYPPGFLTIAANTQLFRAIQETLLAPGQYILRDMGKTIFAPYAESVSNGQQDIFKDYGYYRQYQFLKVNPITGSQGFFGGPNGSTFGVLGPSSLVPPSSSTYLTFYLPVTVTGVLGSGCLPFLNPLSGAQM